MIIQIRMLIAQIFNGFKMRLKWSNLSCIYALVAHLSVYGFGDNTIEMPWLRALCFEHSEAMRLVDDIWTLFWSMFVCAIFGLS